MLCFLVFAFLFQIRLLAFEHPARSVRMSVSTDLSTTPATNQATVDKLAANYVNEVLIWVKSSVGGNPNTTGLADFITKAHVAGIKVVLEYTVSVDAVYTDAHPDAKVYHSPDATTHPRPYINPASTYINLLYPGYKDLVAGGIASLVRDFNVDGICLESLRYNLLEYSFDTYNLQRAAALGCDTTHLLSLFNTEPNYTTYGAGTTASRAAFIGLYTATVPDPDVVKWVNMRKGVLSEYITAIRTAIESVRPGIQLSALYSEEPVTDVNAPGVHYAQDYALHSTLLDVISPNVVTTASLASITHAAAALVYPGCKMTTYFTRSATVGTQINDANSNDSYGVIIQSYSSILPAEWTAINPLFLAMQTATSIKEVEELSSDFILKQNYPNPFNTTTEIAFQVTKPCLVSLNVYDALGRQVAPLINKKMDSGTHKVNFDAKGLAEGVYFYRLNMDGSSSARKMTLKK